MEQRQPGLASASHVVGQASSLSLEFGSVHGIEGCAGQVRFEFSGFRLWGGARSEARQTLRAQGVRPPFIAHLIDQIGRLAVEQLAALVQPVAQRRDDHHLPGGAAPHRGLRTSAKTLILNS